MPVDFSSLSPSLPYDFPNVITMGRGEALITTCKVSSSYDEIPSIEIEVVCQPGFDSMNFMSLCKDSHLTYDMRIETPIVSGIGTRDLLMHAYPPTITIRGHQMAFNNLFRRLGVDLEEMGREREREKEKEKKEKKTRSRTRWHHLEIKD
jgi:hypothetical protein